MNAARQIATDLVWSAPARKRLLPLSTDQIEKVIQYLTQLIELTRIEAQQSQLAAVYRENQMEERPLRNWIVSEALCAGFRLGLEGDETTKKTAGEMVH